MIELYTDATPNGFKISIALEELEIKYKAYPVYLGGEQMTPEFTQMNPNQKIPVLKDNDLTIIESGAILLYLAEKTGKLLPTSIIKRNKAIEILMLQMSGLGPNFGQLLVWAGAWENKHPIATERYLKEVVRLFNVLNNLLENNNYFAGDYSIADIAIFPWIRMAYIHPIGKLLNIEQYKNLNAWYERINKRKAVQQGLLIPKPNSPEKQTKAFVSAVVGLGELHK